MYEVITLNYQQLLAHSAHIGHNRSQTLRFATWFIVGERYKLSIIDLLKSVFNFRRSIFFIDSIIRNFGSVLFVNIDKFAAPAVKISASLCGQPYITYSWVGGLLTNWKTIVVAKKAVFKKKSINKLKLDESLLGVVGEIKLPAALYITSSDSLAAAKWDVSGLLIPVIAIVDTIVNSVGFLYPIPGNDDAVSAVLFYNVIVSKSILISKFKAICRFRALKLSYFRSRRNFIRTRNKSIRQRNRVWKK